MSVLFPELGRQESREPSSPAPSLASPAITTDPARTASPGPGTAEFECEGNEACVKAFSAALRLPVGLRSVWLARSGAVRLELEPEEAGRVRAIFLVEPTAPHWKRNAGFGIQFAGGELPLSFHRPLLAFLARYQRAVLEAFAGRVRANAGSSGWTGRRPSREDDPLRLPEDMDDSLFRSYGLEGSWRTFFEDHDLYRGSCTHTEGRVAQVMHRDIECDYSHAPQSAWGAGTFAGFATDRAREPEGGKDSRSETLTFITNVDDRDVILGGGARLDAALEAIAAMPERPDVVLVNSTCISVVTGDDLEASAERIRRKHGLPIIALGCVEHPVEDALLAQLSRVPREPVPGAAALVGTPRIAGIESTLAALREAGIDIDGPLLPDLPAGFDQALARASVLVVYDQAHTRGSVSQLVEACPDATVVSPPPPFGFEATRAFFDTVGAACGARDRVREFWGERYGALEERWRTGVERASRYQVLLVSDRADWKARLWARLGLPLMDTLLGMGFGIDVLAYVGAGEEVAESSDPRISVRTFSTREELADRLLESRAPLAYSDQRFDPRLTRSGHACLSLEDFRCGAEGAVEMLEALVRRCELPWFRRYGSFAGQLEDVL